MEKWLAGDLPGWIAVGLAVLGAAYAYRALRAGYLELQQESWKTDWTEEGLKVTGQITVVSPAAQFNATCILSVGRRRFRPWRWEWQRRIRVPLTDSSSRTYVRQSTMTLTFEKADESQPPVPADVELDIGVRLSDGTRMRGRMPFTIIEIAEED